MNGIDRGPAGMAAAYDSGFREGVAFMQRELGRAMSTAQARIEEHPGSELQALRAMVTDLDALVQS